MLENIFVFNLQIFVISWSVCSLQAFPAYYLKCSNLVHKCKIMQKLNGKNTLIDLNHRCLCLDYQDEYALRNVHVGILFWYSIWCHHICSGH